MLIGQTNGNTGVMAGTLLVHREYYFCLKLCKLILILYIQNGLLYLLRPGGGAFITSKPIMLRPPKLHRIRYSSFPASGYNAKYGIPRKKLFWKLKSASDIFFFLKLHWETKVLRHFRKVAPFCVMDIPISFLCLPQPLPPKVNGVFWTLKSFFYFRKHWFGG